MQRKLPYFAEPSKPEVDLTVPATITFETLHGILPKIQPGQDMELFKVVNNTMQEWGSSNQALERYRDKTALCLRLLEDAYGLEPESVARIYHRTLNELYRVQKELYFSEKDAQTKTPDEHAEVVLKPQLTHYHDLYENYYRLLISPVAFAKDVISRSPEAATSADDYLRLDARVKMEKLNSPLAYVVQPLNILVEGCEPSLRNGIAHKRYRFGDDTVEVWDESPKRGVHWKKTFTKGDLDGQIRKLQNTVNAIETGLLIFLMKHRKEMHGRGYDFARPSSELSFEQQQSALYLLAEAMRMELLSAECVAGPPKELVVKVKILPSFESEGPEKIISGGERGPTLVLNFYREIEEASLKEQVFGFLQRACGAIDNYDEYWVTVEGPEGQDFGFLRMNQAQLQDMARGLGDIEALQVLECHLDRNFKVKQGVRRAPRNAAEVFK